MGKKYFLIVVLLVLIFHESYSQVNIQPYVSYVRNLNPDYKANTYGGGIRFEFGRSESTFSYYAGFGYNLAIKKTAELEARAYSNFTSPETVPVTAKYSLPMYRLEGGSRFYFAGEQHNYEGFNFYANLGAEVIVTPNKPVYSDFDRSLYGLGFSTTSDVNEDGTEKVAINLMLAGGLGIEKNVGMVNIFMQLGIAFPATRSGNSDISSSIESFTPIPVNLNFGIKLPISSRE